MTTYAKGLAVVAGNATGRQGPDMAIVTKLVDHCVPKYSPGVLTIFVFLYIFSSFFLFISLL